MALRARKQAFAYAKGRGRAAPGGVWKCAGTRGFRVRVAHGIEASERKLAEPSPGSGPASPLGAASGGLCQASGKEDYWM